MNTWVLGFDETELFPLLYEHFKCYFPCDELYNEFMDQFMFYTIWYVEFMIFLFLLDLSCKFMAGEIELDSKFMVGMI